MEKGLDSGVPVGWEKANLEVGGVEYLLIFDAIFGVEGNFLMRFNLLGYLFEGSAICQLVCYVLKKIIYIILIQNWNILL